MFNLDDEAIKNLEKGIIKGTPLRLDEDVKMSDIENVWGKPNEHRDLKRVSNLSIYHKKSNFLYLRR